MPARVLCTLGLPSPFLDELGRDVETEIIGHITKPAELCDRLTRRPADVLCVQLEDAIDDAVLAAGMPRLRAVAIYAVGYNNVDVAAATRHGVVVGNTPGVLTDATADLTMALLLAAARRVVEGDAMVRAGEFTGWRPDLLLGADLTGALLGIVGFGRIGQAVARRARGFGLRIAAPARPDRARSADMPEGVEIMPLDDLIGQADFLSLHCPLTAETRHLIDASRLRRMKPTAILINTARGAIVDEEALVTALRDGWIAAAALDVFEHEPALAAGLAGCRNLVLMPHAGSATVRTRAAMALLCAGNARDALLGRVPRHCVNPQAWADATPTALIDSRQ